MVWYVTVCMVSMHKSIKGGFRRSQMTDRTPYNIVCLDYLVYLVYGTTGGIGGNGSIRLLVVSVVMVVSGVAEFRRIWICVYWWYLEY